jgi:general nucleoside transport system ATP-binding protein
VLLELQGITKRFGAFVANDAISLTVQPGEIHALLGENGAGKSTLMNVLYGLYQPDGGQILVDGKPVSFRGPGDAMAAGIGMVHQHFMLIPVFTVAENVALGHEDTGIAGFLDRRRTRRDVAEVSARYGLAVPPDALLPVGIQQRVEIVKALMHNAQVLILDEPTAVLTPQETDDLMRVMGELRDSGTSIVFITHKLREVRAIADRITVIRRGKVVGEASPDSSSDELASLMVGRPVKLTIDKAAAQPGATVLEVDNLKVVDDKAQVVVDGVTIQVRAGEIYALAGVQGNGQTELTEALVGLETITGGRIRLAGEDITSATIDDILEMGVGYVPEDRLHDGLVGSFSIAENLILDTYDHEPFAKGISMDLAAVSANADQRVGEFDVRTTSAQASASSLSGGNQQKVVLARELSRPLKLLVVAQPTRGLDVGSIEFVHKRIVAERDNGAAVVLVSTELDEVLGLADRIGVMYRGKIIGEVPGGTSAEEIGLLMAGSTTEHAVDPAAGQMAEVATAAATNPALGGFQKDAPADAQVDQAANQAPSPAPSPAPSQVKEES